MTGTCKVSQVMKTTGAFNLNYCILCRTNIPRKQGGLGEINITLLADRSHAISRAYGVLKEEVGNPYR